MRISVLQENLAKGLAIVARAVATRSTLPVLSNILLETDQSQLKLSAMNMEIGINCWIGAMIEEEGAITVPARLLSDFVASLPKERIDMELNVRTQTLHLRCARNEANIKGIDASEFPIIPTYRRETGLPATELPPDKFRRMIDQVAFAAASDESRPTLTGVYTRLDGERLRLVATDGFRLAVRSTLLEEPAPAAVGVIVPARALTELSRILGAVELGEDDGVQVTITEARNQIMFHLPGVDLVSQLIEANFPDYNKIVPSTYNTRVVVNTAEFLKAMRLSYLFARDAANIVRLSVVPGDPGKIVLTATSNEMGDNEAEVDALVEGESVQAAFNAKFMIDVLSVVETPEVVFEVISASRPGVVRPVGAGEEEYVHVIMPMSPK
ncbi:MAG: DNA polymerase III subunit beta [Caldilineales bacterium]|nr:DNA polymerase III subunit beta [Caldilineales bacterium]MCW5860129.1 DNA polymerase III subunit beta [Caldilineales bacterium]